jgi:DNA-binding winged helix-turn-helix (wHTH) protein
MLLKAKDFYVFGNFRIDLAERSLMRTDAPIPLTPKVFDTLLVLVENAGRTVEKEEIIQRVWQERFVQENNLTFNIKMLRKALGDDAGAPRFIATVPRRGYRFIALVEKISVPEVTIAPVNSSNIRPGRRFGWFAIAAVFLAVLLIGAVGFNAWYGFNSTTGAPVMITPFTSEMLSTNGKVAVADISPDGRTVVYRQENANKHSIWLRQIDTGENIEIIPPTENVYYGLEFSPNGNFIYFSRRPSYDDRGYMDLYRVSIFGGVPERVVAETQGWVNVSADGTKILFARCARKPDEYCSLFIADAANGANEKKLLTRPAPFRIPAGQISQDGHYAVIATGQSENQSNEFGLYEIDLQTGAGRDLTPEKFFNIKGLSWLPGGRDMIISASRTPNRKFRLWHISGSDGLATPLTKHSDDYSQISLDSSARLISAIQLKADFNLIVLDREDVRSRRVLNDATTASFGPSGKVYFSS